MTSRRSPRRPAPPLDTAALEALALRYVERFATTRGKLAAYLARKVRERGWEGAPADPRAIAERMAQAGYVDDRAFAEARARSLARRGFGVRRVGQALRAARVGDDDAVAAMEAEDSDALAVALAYARRRRIGPFARGAVDDRQRQRDLAALLRAGHDFTIARRIVAAQPGELPETDD